MEGSDDVYVHKFSISMGGKTLFNDCKLALMHGRRYGLIGPNGCGKSTLMTALGYGTNEDIKAGTPPNMDILLVEQEVEASDEITALEMVLSADTKRTALLKEQAELEKQLEEGGVKYIKKAKLTPIDGGEFKKDTRVRFEGRECTVLEEIDEDGDITIQDVFDEDGALAARLRDVYDELADIGADSAETRASTILTGLQFLEEQKSWPTSSFSGGWRMRISLARALFRKPRLLLLDEPTNHLDLHAVIWLEGYLQKWKHTIVVVSHDRDFLTTVCTDILHCWQKKLVHYAGNYEVFEKVHSSRLEEYKKEFERQQKRLKELRKTGKVGKELDKKDIQTVLGRTGKESRKEMKDFGGAGGSDDEDVALLDEIKHLNMRIHFAVGGEIAMPMLAVDKVSFGYPNQPILFKNVDFGLNMDSRVALVGANGTGKSTLLKLMLQELDPTEGEVRQSRMCRIGVYNQHSCDQLAKDVRLAKGEKLTPVTYLMHKFHDYNYQQVRDMLGRFGLEGHHHEQEIATLSGGQKSRVVFVELGMQRSHLLLLDEPTNHLDRNAVDWLTTHLNSLDGVTIGVVSHDYAFIDRVVTDVVHYDNGGKAGQPCVLNYYAMTFSQFQKLHPEVAAGLPNSDKAVARMTGDAEPFLAASGRTESLEATILKVDEMVASGQILPIRFPDPGKPEGIRTYRKPIMTLKNISFTYEGSDKPVLTDASVSVTLGSRVVLLGANGAGKTTFLKILVGDLEANQGQGEAWTHHNLRVSYIAQHSLHHLEEYLNSNPIAYLQERFRIGLDREVQKLKTHTLLPEEKEEMKQIGSVCDVVGRQQRGKDLWYEIVKTGRRKDDTQWFPEEEIKKMFPKPYVQKLIKNYDEKSKALQSGLAIRPITAEECLNHLADFGIMSDLAHGKIKQLSGGQRQRLVISAAFWSKPHLIALDEPTNYLDNDTLAALTQALKDFKGAVVTVSHNEAFVAEISNEKWVVENGQITVVQLRDAKMR